LEKKEKDMEKELEKLVKENKHLKEELKRITTSLNSVYIDNVTDIPEFLTMYNEAVEVLLSMMTKEQLKEFKEKYEKHYGVLDSIFLFELK